MFDVLVAAAPHAQFSARVASALRGARLRVIACQMGPTDPPPSSFRVDAAVVCASNVADVGSIARRIGVALEGPPPVVGVTPGAGVAPTGTVDLLGDDAPDALVVARVQRAASTTERRRSRTLMSGDLGGVGAKALLSSLLARRRTFVLRVQSGPRRAEISVDAGGVAYARADGAASPTLEKAIAEIDRWTSATFEVVGNDEPAAAVSAPPSVETRTGTAPMTDTSDDATDVALAAAILNAFAAYARAFLPADVVVAHLDRSRDVARSKSPGIDAFAVSRTGMVSVTKLSLARSALPEGLATWCNGFFAECARSMPGRFGDERISDVLGGLSRLMQKVGWSEASFRGRVRT